MVAKSLVGGAEIGERDVGLVPIFERQFALDAFIVGLGDGCHGHRSYCSRRNGRAALACRAGQDLLLACASQETSYSSWASESQPLELSLYTMCHSFQPPCSYS